MIFDTLLNGGRRSAVIVWVILFLLMSCGNNRKKEEILYPSVERTGQQCDTIVELDGKIRVLDIAVSDSLMFLLTNDNPMLYVIDLKCGDIVEKTAFVGRANNEHFMIPHGIDIREHAVQFFDRAKKRMCYISLPDFHETGRDVVYTSDFRPSRAVDIDGSVICVGAFSSGRVGVVARDNTSRTYYEYPFDTGDVEGIYRGSIFQSDIRVPKNRKAVLVYALASDSFEIYDFDSGTLNRKYVNPVENAPEVKRRGGRISVDHDRGVAGILHAATSDSSFFLLWSGKTYNETAKKGFSSDLIREYDWSGKHLRDYILPMRIVSMCVYGDSFYSVVDGEDCSIVVKMPKE